MVTVNRQQAISTVTETTNIKKNISDVIDMLSPSDVPMLSRIGYASLKFPCDQVKHEWMEDDLTPSVTTLAAAYTAGSGQMTVASGAGNYFYVDDTLLVGNNNLRILAISGDVLTVIGGLGDSTDAAAASGATVRRLGHAAPEGGVSRMDSRKTNLTAVYNYTQIFKDWCILTGTMEVISRYGYVSERAYQEEKAMRRQAIMMEHAVLYGAMSYDAGPPRRSTFGGLKHYIFDAGVAGSWATVHNAAGSQITETLLNNVLQSIWEVGGMPSLIVVNGFNKRIISSWASPYIRTDRTEGTIGNQIGTYASEFGTLEIMMDRWLRPSDVLILDPSQIGLGPLNGRAFSSHVVPSLGDYTQTEVLGEYTMEVHKGSESHGWIYNTSES